MSLDKGQILQGRYRIVELIGQGGFGAVYRGWDMTLGRPCAVKENLDTSEEAQRQFQREATLLAKLSHPNLPRMADHFFVPGQGQYLVMDFVQGQSLKQHLVERGRALSEAEILPWITQVCEALIYLHSQTPPIIHRDIKPDNIIVTPEGRAMLVDFGISKVYDAQFSTTMGARAITPGFSPPEQYGIGKTAPHTDVYAIGATLYMLLTGQQPPESVAIIADESALPPPRQINPTISIRTERAILLAMDVSTTRRLPNAAALLTALQANSQGLPGILPINRRRIGLVVIGVIGILILVAAAFLLRSFSTADTTPTPVVPVAAATTPITTLITPALSTTPNPALLDEDQDGLTNAQEDQLGTDPMNSDTDGDNLDDGAEQLQHQTDPLNKDSDADLLTDGDEIEQYLTNPTLADSDGDNRTDAIELAEGTDPLVAPTTTPSPSPSAIATPTDHPPATPTSTVTPACPAISGPFANAWGQVKNDIGCAANNAVAGVIVEENFVGGKMFWREPIDYAQALVLFDNGTWRIYSHAPYNEGDPEYPCTDANTPAQSPPTPRRGFGTMWCDISAIRNGLGNATDVERAFNGTMQSFENGFMVATDYGAIFICYSDGTWEQR
ncbi:MAG: protein kinase [Candidatus Promineifilaceae bacterium]